MRAAVTDAAWLGLLVLIVPAAWLAWTWLRATMSTPRVVSVVVLRAALIACVAAMLAGLSTVRETDRLTVVLVIDGSDSVREFAGQAGVFGTDAQGRPLDWDTRVRAMVEGVSADLGPDDLVGVVVFDGLSLAVSAPSRRGLTGAPVDVRGMEGTDIESALRLASRLIPPDSAGRIVLVSDGVETGGDAVAAAREIVGGAAGGGRGGLGTGVGSVRVDVVPVTYRVRNEVMIDAVDAPPNANAGGRITLRVALRSTDTASGRIEVLYNGALIDANGGAPGTGVRVTLEPGRTVVPIDIELDPEGEFHRFEPRFIPDEPAAGAPPVDRVLENNVAETFTYTEGTASVLIVDGRELGGVASGVGLDESAMAANPLRLALESAEIGVQSVAPIELPESLLGLQGYDLVVLQDVGAADLPRPAHEMLSRYVSALGGGLVMVGGPDSFGAGGWKGTALEPILPVQLDLPDEVVEPQAAIAFVLDKSGSMSSRVGGGSKTQQEIANEGAAFAIRTLDPTDLLTVIAFDNGAQTVIPMGPVDDNTQKAERVLGIAAGGGTSLFPAMRQGATALINADAKVKHMVILSDGQSSGDPDAMIELAAELQARGVTVSTIAVGDGADVTTLREIATASNGVFYPVTDPTVLPQIFIRDTQFVRRPLIRLKPFLPVVTGPSSPVVSGSPAWRGGAQVPPLEGLVLTQARDDARVSNVLTSDDGYPLLSHWFVGRGQVAAFTSDADAWASAWVRSRSWDGYRSMWTAIARTISRSALDPNAELVMSVEGGELVVSYASFEDDGTPIDGLRVDGTVVGPDGETAAVRLSQVAPGQYEARVPARSRGNYVAVLSPMRGAQQQSPVVGGASRALGPEYSALTSDLSVLQRIADAGEGTVWSLDQIGAARGAGGADLFDRAGVTPSRSMTPLWPILLGWTIVVFVLDVATRRVAWDRLLNRELMADWKRAVREAAEGRGQAAVATVGGLRERASAVRRQSAGGGDTSSGRPAEPMRSRTTETVDPGVRMADVVARQRETRGRLRGDTPSTNDGVDQQRAGASDRESRPQRPAQVPPPKPAPKPGPPSKPGTQDAGGEEPKSTTEGLLAAKRRARDRGG